MVRDQGPSDAGVPRDVRDGDGRRWRPVRVLFYSHAIHKGRQPSPWFVLLDLAGRVVSPRYTRCTLEVDDTIYCVTGDGWRRVPSRTYAFPPSAVVETIADVAPLERMDIPETTTPRRLSVMQIVLAFVFPRHVAHCSTLIGPLLGLGPIRTPDRLHALLARGEGRDRAGGAGPRAFPALGRLASDSATSAGGADSGGS